MEINMGCNCRNGISGLGKIDPIYDQKVSQEKQAVSNQELYSGQNSTVIFGRNTVEVSSDYQKRWDEASAKIEQCKKDGGTWKVPQNADGSVGDWKLGKCEKTNMGVVAGLGVAAILLFIALA